MIVRRLSIDQQRGIYYELHWGDFHDGVMRALSERGESPSKLPWPYEEIWNATSSPTKGAVLNAPGTAGRARRSVDPPSARSQGSAVRIGEREQRGLGR